MLLASYDWSKSLKISTNVILTVIIHGGKACGKSQVAQARYMSSSLYKLHTNICRGSKPVPLKLTGMAVNRLKDHTGGNKSLN